MAMIGTKAIASRIHSSDDLGCVPVQSADSLVAFDIRSTGRYRPRRITSLVPSSSRQGRLYATTASHALFIGEGAPFAWHRMTGAVPAWPRYSIGSRRDVLYAAQQSVFVSRSGGHQWRRLSCGLILTDMTMSPTHPRTIYVAATGSDVQARRHLGGVYASFDAGASWRRSTRFPGVQEPSIRAVAVDPTDAHHVLSSTEGGGILSSNDDGRDWILTRTRSFGQHAQVNDLAFGPASSGRAWAATTEAGVLRSEDRGASWRLAGLVGTRVDRVVPHPVDPRIAYIDTASGLFRTNDSGAHWRLIDPSGAPVTNIAVSPEGDRLYASSPDSVFVSTNSGNTWIRLPGLPG